MTAANAFLERTDLLPAGVPTPVIALLALGAAALWLGARRITHRYREHLPLHAVVTLRVLTAAMAAWCALQLFARLVVYGCRWPLWAVALGAGLAVESMAALYHRERRVVPHRTGLWLTALRGAAIILAVLIILQPVLMRTRTRHIARRVAVLLDESDSMRFVDRQWTAGEQLELAQQAGLLAPDERRLPALEPLTAATARLRPWAEAELGTASAPEALHTLLNEMKRLARDLQAQLEETLAGAGTEAGAPLERLCRQVRDALAPALDESLAAAQEHRLEQAHLLKVLDALQGAGDAAGAAREAADAVVWQALAEERREAIARHCAATRFSLARHMLTQPPANGGESLLDALARRYDVEHYRLARGAVRTTAPGGAENGDDDGEGATNAVLQAFRSSTDIAAALETVIKDVPSEQLAGILILSDGRHNGDTAVEPVARRLGAQGVPVAGVLVGSRRPPLDVALADVSAPESIYLGDRVRLRVTVSATGARGRQIGVRLLNQGETVDETTLDIAEDDWQREIRLAHAPAAKGIESYEIRTDVLEGELFPSNNVWRVDVAVSDDRTHVLLVDDYPRWEFRYLRNLFYGRDKSVHLQYVLLHPDTIRGVEIEQPLPPASASRPFMEAEAGSLPAGREEWRKFDAIILGDLDAGVLTDEVMAHIRDCVAERGALLVVVAGPRAMPHSFAEDSPLAEMMPFRYMPRIDGAWTPPEAAFRVVLTPAGLHHPVMQQSAGLTENEAIWNEVPYWAWRFPVDGPKPGAEVLAYAEPLESPPSAAAPVNVRNALERLEEELRRRGRNALVTAHSYGRGKVLALTSDRTWRLRYRVGDTRHHRFWGQTLRWGLGERLRDGTPTLRVGTDRIVYAPAEPVRVLARVLTEDFAGVADARLRALLRRAEDGATGVVSRVTPAYRKDSEGMYEATFPSPGEPGRYRIEVARLDGRGDERVETTFLVATARRPRELACVAATRETLDTLARWTGGQVTGPARAMELATAFGEGRRTLREPLERPLWDRPWVLLLLLGLLTAEWVLRKHGGLP